MLWDDAEIWKDGLRSLGCLERLLLRTQRSLREAASSEDVFVHGWLLSSPPVLSEVIIWTKMLSSAASGTGERLVKWRPKVRGIGWWKAYEQNGNVDEGDFI